MFTTNQMTSIFREQGEDAKTSSSVEEVQLRNITFGPSGHFASTHNPKKKRPGRIEQHLQASKHDIHYKTAESHDHSPLLELDTGLSDTHHTEEPGTHSRSRFTRAFTPLQRLQARLADRKERSRYHGWRMGVLIGCFMSFFVLCCNITLLLVGATRQGGYSEGGVANLLRGDKTVISRWNTALHILINILSTILLAGSNYTMQVLSSPTRKEIDRAHHHGDWLVVGLLSPRNWKRIAKKRVLLCLVLGVSSIPLHLFYNAATFKVLAQNWYSLQGIHRYSPEYDYFAVNTSYVNLKNSQWKSDFAAFNTSYGYTELIVVYDEVIFEAANKVTNNSTIERLDFFDGFSHGSSVRQEFILAEEVNATDWLPPRPYFKSQGSAIIHIAHAFAVEAHTQSRIQLCLHYMVVVIAANLLKLFIMLNVLITDQSRYLVTLGDAVASFLSSPDPTTERKCLFEDGKILDQIKPSTQVNRTQVGNTISTNSNPSINSLTVTGWHTRTLTYFTLIRKEQARLIIPFLIILVVLSSVFISNTKGGGWSWGISSTSVLSFTDNSVTATIFNAWLANLPQVILSFCYMNLNSFCTAITSAQEWNNLGMARKGLRVSEPRGEQRSTYFLQLPYRWALPLIVVSTALHWLLSQTFFLVRIDIFDDSGNLDTLFSRSACGTSGISFAVFFGMFFGLWIVVRVLASHKLVTNLPQAASNSITISAACHPPKGDIKPHLKPVQWGVVDDEIIEGYRHCSLTSLPVDAPEEGQLYY